MSSLREQEMPDEDLSDLSAPASRGAGLAGLIDGGAPKTVRGGESTPEEAGPPRSQKATGLLDDGAPAPAVRDDLRAQGIGDEVVGRRTRRPGRPRSRVRPAGAVYVSAGVKQRFEAYRHKRKLTNLQVVLEAISSKHDELGAIIRQSTVNTAPVSELFPADPSAVRYLGGGSVQIGFSPTPEQEAKIDQIGAQHGFDTRSTWIAPVLNAFLPGRKD